ncbi:MAG: hypothetical protein K6T68_10550 [Alicyclobacillus shizuokensis]|nr:hypothetical protein [Alicyclobacillus shizuokensis]
MGLKEWIEYALARGASDIHVGSGVSPALRVSGRLEFIPSTPVPAQAILGLVL